MRVLQSREDVAYPSFFHHVFHLLHSGIMIVPGEVEQDTERRDLAAPTRAREMSHCQGYAAERNLLSRLELGKATCK